MVAHSWGLTTAKLASTWLDVRKQIGRNASKDSTLMLACGPDYEAVPGTRMTTGNMAVIL
jgi:hypothetical protein